MKDPRRFNSPEEKATFEEALLRLAADDVPYIRFTVDGKPVMIVSDALDRAAGEVAAAMAEGVNVVKYSEYLAAMSEGN